MKKRKGKKKNYFTGSCFTSRTVTSSKLITLLAFPPPPCSLNSFWFPLASLAQRCSCTHTPFSPLPPGLGLGLTVLLLPALSSAGTASHLPPCLRPALAVGNQHRHRCRAPGGIPGTQAGLCVLWAQCLGARSMADAYPTSSSYRMGRGQHLGPGG